MVRLTYSAASPLLGTWYRDDPGSNQWAVVVFLADGRYMVMEEGSAGGGGQTGIEFGTYTWSSTTGALSVSVKPDGNTDGAWGFSASTVTILVSGATATLSDGAETVTLTRLEPMS
jgi:hypothetical protein